MTHTLPIDTQETDPARRLPRPFLAPQPSGLTKGQHEALAALYGLPDGELSRLPASAPLASLLAAFPADMPLEGRPLSLLRTRAAKVRRAWKRVRQASREPEQKGYPCAA
jgi:hypothetical protein